mmetsp:Transcript_19922/g.46664  ORF Transcript_19922/g.46664 Transcript_19922/m.46664 type:complete len:202 (-) Transcript_19922:741-1346(-)
MSRRSKIFCRIFLSISRLWSSSCAKFSTSLSLTSAKVSTTTATIRFKTPKTSVKEEPTNMRNVSGCRLITGTAISPQLSPAMTVLNRSRLAPITDSVACKQSAQSANTSSVRYISLTCGWTISTIIMAQIVIITKQNRKDHARAFIHVVSMMTNFCNSLRERLFRSRFINRTIRAKRNTRSVPKESAKSPPYASLSITNST